jgi:hypothetical protein
MQVDLQSNDGCAPLHWTAEYGHASVMEQLNAARCNVNLQKKDGHTTIRSAMLGQRRSAGAVRSAGSPQSQLQSDRTSRGREACRSAVAVRSARSPQSLGQWDRTSRCREPCTSARAMRSAGSPESLRQSDRTSRGREASIFVARSSLWPSFVGTLHCLLFAICFADRQQERATYCTHTAWSPSGLHIRFEI